MIDELRAMAIFAKVVESGSFRAAADKLKLSPSVVSHHISKLEQQLSTTLLYRSTRRISLTDNGNKLFIATQMMLEAAENGLNNIAARSAEPSGNLSLTVPAMFTHSELMDDIAAFAKRYPKVRLTITFSDLAQDLVRDGIDLAIRIGALKDSALKCRRLFDMPRTLVASSEVVAHRKVAHREATQHPQQLLSWDWIALTMRPNHKLLINATGEQVQLDYQPRITVDSLEAVCQLTLAGLGLSSPPTFMVAKPIAEGRLTEVLPDWQIESLGVYAVWPGNATPTSLSYRLVEFLSNAQSNSNRLNGIEAS